MTSQMIGSLVLLYCYQARAASSRTILGGFPNPKLPKSVDEFYFTILIFYLKSRFLTRKIKKSHPFYADRILGHDVPWRLQRPSNRKGRLKQWNLQDWKIYFWGPACFQGQFQGAFWCKCRFLATSQGFMRVTLPCWSLDCCWHLQYVRHRTSSSEGKKLQALRKKIWYPPSTLSSN